MTQYSSRRQHPEAYDKFSCLFKKKKTRKILWRLLVLSWASAKRGCNCVGCPLQAASLNSFIKPRSVTSPSVALGAANGSNFDRSAKLPIARKKPVSATEKLLLKVGSRQQRWVIVRAPVNSHYAVAGTSSGAARGRLNEAIRKRFAM